MSQLAAGLKICGNRQHFSWFLLQSLSCTETKKRVYAYWWGQQPGTAVQPWPWPACSVCLHASTPRFTPKHAAEH